MFTLGYCFQHVIMDFMVKTALSIASVHAMGVTILMEFAIPVASLVGKELIVVKVNIYIYTLVNIYHPLSLSFSLSLSLSLSLSAMFFRHSYPFKRTLFHKKRE